MGGLLKIVPNRGYESPKLLYFPSLTAMVATTTTTTTKAKWRKPLTYHGFPDGWAQAKAIRMEPRIETLIEKKLIGKRLIMTLAENKTSELWRNFMPRRKEIQNSIGTELYSMQVYGPSYFDDFSLNKAFKKWAAVEVKDFNTVPEEMDTFILKGGHYAVFHYKGLSTDNTIFQHIFTTWLPKAEYLLDNRPHFEILGDKYKNGDPGSEEEIWIPIRPKR